MITQLYNIICQYADKWHQANLDLFDFNENLEGIDYEVVKLLYHNYQIWHFIELYKSPNSNVVLYVYDGGIKHNKLRNETIEKVDNILCKNQKNTGKINSETIGSVIDRIGILYIKTLHLKDDRLPLVKNQLETLVNCASDLMDDMVSGRRRCELFSRFKIEYSE